jgi:hypothetical protein
VRSESNAFVTIDRGTASTAVTLIGRIDDRWRLLGATAGPASVAPEALTERLRRRLWDAAPAISDGLHLERPGSTDELPRRVCATTPPPEIAVIAATHRAVAPLAAAARTSGWRVRPVALEGAQIVTVAGSLADPRLSAVLAGAGDPPGADERPLMGELLAQVAAVADRRPDLTIVLTGSLAEAGSRYELAVRPARPGATIMGPAPATGNGAPLRRLLDGVRSRDDDGRRALATATAALADVLRQPVELVEIGQSAGMRAVADHAPGTTATVESAVVADAALLPRGFTDSHLDAVIGWLTIALDRLRIRDRLREVAVAPWADVGEEGTALRLASARAALHRLGAATPHLDGRPPGIVVAAGGVWSLAPAPVVALALADAVRLPGVRAFGLDHARLLAPLGTIADATERREVMTDLRDELVAPLGSIVMPAGLRPGRSAGRAHVRRAGSSSSRDLHPGSIERVELDPGERAVAELEFRDRVDLGVRTRNVAMEVVGGAAGMLIDLRDVPLRLPQRSELRREQLADWQRAVWPAGSS